MRAVKLASRLSRLSTADESLTIPTTLRAATGNSWVPVGASFTPGGCAAYRHRQHESRGQGQNTRALVLFSACIFVSYDVDECDTEFENLHRPRRAGMTRAT